MRLDVGMRHLVAMFFSILLAGCYSCKDSGRPLVTTSMRFDYATIESGFYSHASRVVLGMEDSLMLRELLASCKGCQYRSDPDVMVTPAIAYTVTFRSNRSSEMFAPKVAFGANRGLYQAGCTRPGAEAEIARILKPYMDKVDQLEAKEDRKKQPVY